MKKILPITMILIMTASCMFKEGKYVQDNMVEEVAEEVLDAKTGIDLDFSPSSKEK